MCKSISRPLLDKKMGCLRPSTLSLLYGQTLIASDNLFVLVITNNKQTNTLFQLRDAIQEIYYEI